MTKKPEPLDPEEFDRIAATLEALGILFPHPVSRCLWHGS